MIIPKIFWCYCLLIFQVMCRDPPTVKIKGQGSVVGRFIKLYRTQSIVAYLGIPYAHPPVNELRFMPPFIQDLPSWDGVRNGSISQPNCYQNMKTLKQKHTMVLDKLLSKVMDMDAMMMEVSSDRYDEDCLYLNIFVPDGKLNNPIQLDVAIDLFSALSNMHFCSLPNVCLVLFLLCALFDTVFLSFPATKFPHFYMVKNYLYIK